MAAKNFVSLSAVSLRLIKEPEHRPVFEKQLIEQLREILVVPKTVAITTMPDSPLWWQRAKTIAETMETERKFKKEHPECANSPTGKHEWRFGKCMWCGTEATEIESSSETTGEEHRETHSSPKVMMKEDFVVIDDKWYAFGPQVISAPSGGEIIKRTRDWEIRKIGDRYLYTHYEYGQHWLEESEPVYGPGIMKGPLDFPKRPPKRVLALAEATVRKEEISTFTPAFLSLVKKAWEGDEPQSFWEWVIEPRSDVPAPGVVVRLRGVDKPHEFFPKEIIEKMKYDASKGIYVVES